MKICFSEASVNRSSLMKKKTISIRAFKRITGAILFIKKLTPSSKGKI